MNNLIKFLKVSVIPIGFVFLFPLVLGILNLLGIESYKIMILIFMGIISLLSGFIIGKKTDKKGYINGLILGLSLSIFFFIFSLLFKNSYKIDTLLYYLIIIVFTTFGSMIGIQKKEET